MWNPGELVLKNVGTHKETKYTFIPDKAVMFTGLNMDDLGAMSNGSGKSTLGDGVSLALTGNSLRGVRTVKLVRRGEDFLEVEWSLVNSQTKDTLYIYRKIFSNTNSNQLKVLFNDKVPPSVPDAASGKGCVDIKKGTDFILQTLGISEDDLLNYYILSKDSYQPFLLSTDGAMKKVIDRFSNAKLIDPVFTLLKKDFTSIGGEISNFERDLIKCDTKIESYEEELEKIKETDLEKEKNELVQKYETEISQEEEDIRDYTSSLKKIEKEKKEIEKEVITTKTELDELIKERDGYLTDKTNIQTRMKQFEDRSKLVRGVISKKQDQETEFIDIKSDLYKKIQGSIECPECHHEFSLAEKDFNVKEAKETLEEVKKDIESIQKSIEVQREKLVDIKKEASAVEKEITEIDKKIGEVKIKISKKEDDLSKKKNSVLSKDREFTNTNTSITGSKSRIKILENKIVEEKAREIKDRTQEIEDKIEDVREIKKITEKKIEEKKNELQEVSDQELKFKKFKTYLANQCISSIEGYTNFYLKKIRTNLQVKLNGYRELADGKLKEEISCMILRDGVEEGEIKEYSGGEKAKIILCNIVALQKIINYNTEGGGLNFTFLDEILESIDYSGIVGLYEAANTLKQSINIISHVKDTGFENEVFIKKEDKISRIINREEYIQSLTLLENAE